MAHRMSPLSGGASGSSRGWHGHALYFAPGESPGVNYGALSNAMHGHPTAGDRATLPPTAALIVRGVAMIVTLVLLTCATALAAEGDWPRFRGPNGAGISPATTVPVKWTESDYNWKVTLPGPGHSSPILWGDKLFLTCADPATAKRTILCLKAADGSVLWRRDYPSKTYAQNQDNCYASSTPAADAENVYVTWSVPDEVILLALDHAGAEKWRRNLGPIVAKHGSGTSPIVYEDMVVLANDQEDLARMPGGKRGAGKSFIVAVGRTTGETRWQLDRRTALAAYSTPCVYQPEGGPPELIFTSWSRGVTSVDPKTGKVNWEVADAFPKRVVASPLVAAGLIFGGCGEGGAGQHIMAIRPDAKSPEVAAKEAYKLTRGVPYVPTAVAKGDLVFLWGESSTVICIRAATGQEVWREKVGGQFYGSPVCVSGKLYCISTKGEVVVLAAADKYELLARNALGEPSQATPAVSGGRMYLRTYSHLLSIGGAR